MLDVQSVQSQDRVLDQNLTSNLDKMSQNSHIHPSLWLIVEGSLAEHLWIPPFNRSLRSHEWTDKLHNH